MRSVVLMFLLTLICVTVEQSHNKKVKSNCKVTDLRHTGSSPHSSRFEWNGNAEWRGQCNCEKYKTKAAQRYKRTQKDKDCFLSELQLNKRCNVLFAQHLTHEDSRQQVQNNYHSLPLIDIIKHHAIATFSNIVPATFYDSLSKLKNAMKNVTSADVNLDLSLLEPVSSDVEEMHAPVTYIEVMDDPSLSIGIFVLKQGARLPLHDHPLMYGLMKVVYGTIHIQSYSILMDSDRTESRKESNDTITQVHPHDIGLSQDTLHRQVSLLARKEPAVVVSENDSVCVLTPITGNLHEIHSIDGPAAFLDILSPPYHTDIHGVGQRPCRYFKEVGDAVLENDLDKRPIKKLLRIPRPPDYWSRSAPFQGP